GFSLPIGKDRGPTEQVRATLAPWTLSMCKLPTVKPRTVIRFLEQNGFVLDHVSGSHFIFYDAVSRRRAVIAATIQSRLDMKGKAHGQESTVRGYVLPR